VLLCTSAVHPVAQDEYRLGNPYLRTFLRDSGPSAVIASAIATNFLETIAFRRHGVVTRFTLAFWTNALIYVVVYGRPLRNGVSGGDGRTTLARNHREALENTIRQCISQCVYLGIVGSELATLRLLLRVLYSVRLSTNRREIREIRRQWRQERQISVCDGLGCVSEDIVGVCMRCQASVYCSRGCQREAWPVHRRRCVNSNFRHIIIPDNAV
jgi:hypothetical protein